MPRTSHELGTCAVELLQLGWEAFRTRDPEPIRVAERMLPERRRHPGREHGPHERSVALVCELLATVRTTVDEDVPFTDRALREINSLFERGVELLECVRDAALTENRVLVRHVIGAGAQYAQLAKDYAMAHQQRLQEGVCLPRASSVYLELLEQLERMAAHAGQVAQQLALRQRSSIVVR